jgi:hypothetical protein
LLGRLDIAPLGTEPVIGAAAAKGRFVRDAAIQHVKMLR